VTSGGDIAFGNGKGQFSKPINYPVQSNLVYNVVLADLRNNGLTDIVTDSNDAISVLLSEGKGKYIDGESVAVNGGAGCGAVADYNGDGKPDLAVNGNGITILLGTGNPVAPFQTGANIAQSDPGCFITADLNGDGIPDLLVPTASAVVAYLGNGDGTFRQAGSTPTTAEGYVAVGDFNHDGKVDFATSANLMALGNGDGTFQTPTVITTTPSVTGFVNLAVGDLNNDG
jgi:FG-GAP-like repeat